jgi:hypothetical protein
LARGEHFDRFELSSNNGGVSAKLVVSAAALQRHTHDDRCHIHDDGQCTPPLSGLTITVGPRGVERPAFFS